MIKYKYLFFIITLMISRPLLAKKVLIDPGHGGDDCGAKAKIWKSKKLSIICEKDIALSLAKKIKYHIEKNSKYNAYLTRLIDKPVSLQKRSELADTIKADIFISIHLNAARSKSSHGFETFYLDNHDDAAIKKIEDVENTGTSFEKAIINQILASLVVDRVAPSSKELGTYVHNAISKYISKPFKMKDRGLKPGLFYVLALSKRPSILLEAAFLTNTREAKLAKSNKFQEIYSQAVAKGVIEYLDKGKDPALF